jgi:hypothetical protein
MAGMTIRRLASLALLSVFLALPAHALADGSGSGSAAVVAVDAGVAPSSSDASVAPSSSDTGGAVVVAPPANATPTPASTVTNPADDPGGFIAQVKNAWSAGGWALLLLVLAVGACEGLSKIDSLKKLGAGRVSLVIGGVVAIGTALIGALTAKASWSAAIIAAGGAALAYWHQAGTDPAKA